MDSFLDRILDKPEKTIKDITRKALKIEIYVFIVLSILVAIVVGVGYIKLYSGNFELLHILMAILTILLYEALLGILFLIIFGLSYIKVLFIHTFADITENIRKNNTGEKKISEKKLAEALKIDRTKLDEIIKKKDLYE